MAVSLSGTATAQPAGDDLLNRAAQCLAVKGFLPRAASGKPAFGYLLDDKSYPGKTTIYIVDYRSSSRTSGSVFTVFLTKRNGSQFFNVQNNADFTLTKSGNDGVSFTNPPLGGIWTSEHLSSAIRQIRKQPTSMIPAKDLLVPNSSIKCEAYTDK